MNSNRELVLGIMVTLNIAADNAAMEMIVYPTHRSEQS